jgi:hypothetical protein
MNSLLERNEYVSGSSDGGVNVGSLEMVHICPLVRTQVLEDLGKEERHLISYCTKTEEYSTEKGSATR